MWFLVQPDAKCPKCYVKRPVLVSSRLCRCEHLRLSMIVSLRVYFRAHAKTAPWERGAHTPTRSACPRKGTATCGLH